MSNKNTLEKIIVIAIAIFAIPIHELGHWLGYKFNGISAVLSYNYTDPLTNPENIWGLSGGPLISLGLALLGLTMMYFNKRNKDIWAYFSVVMCLTRIVPYIFFILIPNGFQSNDEGLIAKVLGLQIGAVYITFLALFIGILSVIAYAYKGNFQDHLNKYRLGYGLYLLSIILFGVHIT